MPKNNISSDYLPKFFHLNSDMLTSDDRKEVDLHLQRGSIARGIFRDILELVFFFKYVGGGGGVGA